MTKFLALVKQNLVLAYRGGFFVVILFLAGLFIPLINYAVPQEVSMGATEYVVDATVGKIITPLLKHQGLAPDLILSDESEMQLRIAEHNAVGIVFKGSADQPQAVIYHQGNEPEKMLRTMRPVVSAIWRVATKDLTEPTFSIEQLRPTAVKPPFNKTLVPLLLVIEVVLLGFFLVSVMVFQGKSERTIRAFRVSPGSTWSYIFAKVFANLALAFVYAVLILLFTLGPNLDYFRLLSLTMLGAFLMSVFGLALSVFFNDISEFLYVTLGIFTLMTLPIASYFFPAFKLPIFSFIPSYPLMFGMREIIFPTGKTGFFVPMMLTLLAEAIVMTAICKWTVDKRLMQEVN